MWLVRHVAWLITSGKTELTDEHLLGTVGTPTNLKPDGAAKDPQIRRQYITQRWVDEHGVTPGCPRCEGRGTMTHPETCKKRFDEIEKKKLDKRLRRKRQEFLNLRQKL